MKKTTKIILISVLLISILVILTGCGNNKLMATKESEDLGMKVKETVEVTFKDSKANQVKVTYQFEKEEDATNYFGIMSALLLEGNDLPENTLTQSSNKIIMDVKAEDFLQEGVEETGISREDLKNQLEEDGYTVK